jgi:hypothetical protein
MYGWHAKVHAAGDERLELRDLRGRVKIPMVEHRNLKARR